MNDRAIPHLFFCNTAIVIERHGKLYVALAFDNSFAIGAEHCRFRDKPIHFGIQIVNLVL